MADVPSKPLTALFVALLLVPAIRCSRENPPERPPGSPVWLGATVEYEGAPMALRVRPGADTPSNRERFPQLASISHELDRVRDDGLPEADYNLSLADLDAAIIEEFERDASGVVVIVETLAGERTYYAFVDSEARGAATLAAVRARFPGPRLSLRSMADPEWGLLDVYRELFPW